MADEVGIKWLYPPNFEGTFPEGTPNGHRRYTVQLTGFSDGTGEEDVVKVRRTDLLTPSGIVPVNLVIEKIDYDVSGMCAILEWSSNTADKIAILNASSGSFDYRDQGGLHINDTNPTDDPEWGNIIINTSAGSSDFTSVEDLDPPTFGDSYQIILTIRVKE